MTNQYKINFSNSNNTAYEECFFRGSEIDMLKYVDERLNNKQNKLYNCWIYNNGERMYQDLIFPLRRGTTIKKIINKKLNWKENLLKQFPYINSLQGKTIK